MKDNEKDFKNVEMSEYEKVSIKYGFLERDPYGEYKDAPEEDEGNCFDCHNCNCKKDS